MGSPSIFVRRNDGWKLVPHAYTKPARDFLSDLTQFIICPNIERMIRFCLCSILYIIVFKKFFAKLQLRPLISPRKLLSEDVTEYCTVFHKNAYLIDKQFFFS